MQLGTRSARRGKHAGLDKLIQRDRQQLEWGAAGCSRLVGGDRLTEIVGHGERHAEQTRFLAREGQVAGTDRTQPVARRGGSRQQQLPLHPVGGEPLRGRRDRIEQGLPILEAGDTRPKGDTPT